MFKIDILTCADCGGAVKVIASIEDPTVIRKILQHLDRHVERAPPTFRPFAACPAATTIAGPARTRLTADPSLTHAREAGLTLRRSVACARRTKRSTLRGRKRPQWGAGAVVK